MESKEERASYPVITSLCVFHCLECSEMFMELYREEKREAVVRVDWNEMRWDQKKREQASQ